MRVEDEEADEDVEEDVEEEGRLIGSGALRRRNRSNYVLLRFEGIGLSGFPPE